ncbi:hypothetical protein HZA42_01295 [Candidatus Peregrinibacteria bacterium]|nr:hypothetical protein [Candidatus Peregrinibacteria bacterium]
MVPAGREKSAEELIDDEIVKIKKYKDDIEDIKSGIEYLKGLHPEL